MLIDAHQHFWRIGRPEVAWPTADLAPIHRSFGPEDLRHAAEGLDLAGTVLVQSQPDDRDTNWLCEVAARQPLVLGVVGWADLLAPDAPDRIAALAARPKMRGLRPMLQALPDEWILQPALRPALEALVRADLRFDALVTPRHLPALVRFARAWPDLPIVIDHGAKPAIGDKPAWQAWADGISQLAALPHVFAKLSGLLTEAERHAGDDTLGPYVAHLLDCFGPDRLMWGSDWPVVTMRASYRDWAERAFALLGLEGSPKEAVMHRTAGRFYDL